MKKRKTIITALVAFLVLLLGVNFNAEAQLGGLINAAKNKAKQNKEQKAAEEKAAAEAARATSLLTMAIPQPDANGETIFFRVTNYKGEKPEAICSWNPAKLELTITSNRGGNTPGAVYKVDPATGKVTDSNGASKGAMNPNGTIESPNLGTLTIESDAEGMDYVGKKFKGVRVKRNGTNLSVVTPGWTGSGPIFGKNKEVNVLLAAYVYCGLMLTERDLRVYEYGYDPDEKYTTEQLEDRIEWMDKETINEIMEYESSRPYAGWDRAKYPELKNCKVAAVGLLLGAWEEYNEYHGTVGGGNYDKWYRMKYYVIYELADGRNVTCFAAVNKEFRHGEIKGREGYGNARGNNPEFHEVTDWQRK